MGDGHRAFSVSEDRTIKVWDLNELVCLETLVGGSSWKRVGCVVPAFELRRALSGSSDAYIRLWDMDNTTCLQTMQGHEDRVEALAMDWTSGLALSGSDDCSMKLWDTN